MLELAEKEKVRKRGLTHKKRTFYGWWVISALFVVGMLGPMGRYAATILGPFIKDELGWGAGSLGLALSISLWTYAFASIPVGWMLDRFGSQLVISLGGILLLLGLTGLSRVQVPWQLYICFGIIAGIGVSMTHFLTTQSTARKWFRLKAGLAGGILTAAFYVGSGALSPILTALANWWSWRSACLTYGLGSGAVILILAKVVIRDTPESMGLHPDGGSPYAGNHRIDLTARELTWNTREALGTFSFWMTFIGYCLLGIPGQGLLGHIVFWGVELGAPKAIGGVFLTAYAITTAVTAVFGGWLADKLSKKSVLSISYGICIVILLAAWLTVESWQWLIVLAALFGFAYGVSAGAGLWAAFVGDLFGKESVGRLLGILTFGYGLIGGSGPLIWGKVREITGTYNLACLISAFALFVVVICISLAKPVFKYPQKAARQVNFGN